MGLELGRKVGGVIPSLKTCGHVKRTGGISLGIQAGRQIGRSDLLHSYIMLNRHASRRHGYNVKRTTDLACVRLGVRAYMRTHIPTDRHVDLAVGRATDRLAYLPTCPHKKPKSPAESLKSSTPRRDLKSFSFDGR